MTDAQIWFVLIAGAILILFAIISFADAVKGHPPTAPPSKATTAVSQADSPFDMRWTGPGE